jgi:hypothetical protein
MENVHIIFKGTVKSDTQEHELELFCNNSNEIFIQIENEGYPPSFICLNEETAVKLSKELKKEIAILKGNK